MKPCHAPSRKSGWSVRVLVALAVVAGLTSFSTAVAGLGGLGNNAVGGIMIDASGMVRSATIDERAELLNRLRNQVAEPQGALADATELRMVSLKKLQQAMLRALESGDSLPDEMRMLSGLQRVEYVFVYPETNDIVLAGPAEPWIVREDATVVGRTSGRPVLLLSDLVTALRSVEPSRNGGISCSIEPTAEGRQNLMRLLSRVRLQPNQDPRNLEPMMREAFGPQLIKLNGIPEDSHYARVLVAADYQMKRMAMALEEAPIAGMPSYLELARHEVHASNEDPRWWMACNYDALKHDQERLAWHLTGQGVKTLTEQDRINGSGTAEGTGRQSKTAEKWAELMTQRFDDLAREQSVFGQLRNVMDLSVVATLIVQEGLDQRAQCDLSTLMGEKAHIPLPTYTVPETVSPQCSFIRGRSGWTVTASGGVDVTAFEVVENQQLDAALGEIRTRAGGAAADSWWWNG